MKNKYLKKAWPVVDPTAETHFGKWENNARSNN